jgi:hypothetical protein
LPHTHAARGVIFWARHVSAVLGVVNKPQVFCTVVCSNTVYMIYFILRPNPKTHGPQNAMREKIAA